VDTLAGAKVKHQRFTRSGATEMELWLDENNLPKRPILSERAPPGAPDCIAEFPDGSFDAAFEFQPPAGATVIGLPGTEAETPRGLAARSACAAYCHACA
jgi:hypothetical protein